VSLPCQNLFFAGYCTSCPLSIACSTVAPLSVDTLPHQKEKEKEKKIISKIHPFPGSAKSSKINK